MSNVLADLAASVKKEVPKQNPAKQAVAGDTNTPVSKEDKFKQIKAVEAALNKQFGTTSSLVRLGSKVGTVMPSIGGDIYTFDFDVIGTGGIPRGRLIEFFGPESGGKTTLALHYVAKEQARGGICAYIDAEHALDPNYMQQLGVNVDELVVAQPDSLEQSVETAEALVESRTVTLIVIDSVAALTPQAELDGESGDSHMGLQARLMGQALRKLRGKCAISGIPIIFINQLRTNLGQTYGNPEVTPGGKALKFFASLRVDVRRVGGEDGPIKSGDVVIGHRMKLRAVKNKVGPPTRSTVLDLIYGVGIDTFSDFVTYAKDVGAIQQAGAWFKFNGENIGQGLKNTISQLRENSDLMEKVRIEVTKAITAQREADKQ
jgi:recombination protein RecA